MDDIKHFQIVEWPSFEEETIVVPLKLASSSKSYIFVCNLLIEPHIFA